MFCSYTYAGLFSSTHLQIRPSVDFTRNSSSDAASRNVQTFQG